MFFKFVFAATIALTFSAMTFGDTWTDSTGKYQVEAEFVELKGKLVRLRRVNGSIIEVPLQRLSVADQQKVKRLAKNHPDKKGSQDDKLRSHKAAKNASSDSKTAAKMLAELKVRAVPRWGTAHMRDRNGNKVPPILILGVELIGKPAEEATHFGHVALTKSVADGRKLERKIHFFKDRDISRAFEKIDRNAIIAEHPEDGVIVPINFKNPGAQVGSVSYSGTLKLKTGGQTEIVSIGSLAKTDGKPIVNQHLKAAGINCKVKPTGKNTVRLDLKGNLDVIQSVIVANPEGKKHEKYTGGGSGGGSKEYSCDFDFIDSIPDDAIIKMTLRIDTIELEVPFEFDDKKIAPSKF